MHLTNVEKKFTLVFILIVGFELITAQIEDLNSIHYVFKIAIVSSLIVFFYLNKKYLNRQITYPTLGALLFSLIGDTALLFADKSEIYFSVGLGAFLFAHILYTILFLKHRNITNRYWILFCAFLLAYGSVIMSLLLHNLGNLTMPVIVYLIAIITMATAAFMRKGNVTYTSYWMVLLGAVLFMFSDSILALNKFFQPIIGAQFLIMLSYAFAQYFITMGILRLKL